MLEVIRWCLTSALFVELERSIAALEKEKEGSAGAGAGAAAASSAGATAAGGGGGGAQKKAFEEYELACTQQHAQWVADFEARLAEYIASRGSTVSAFYELCAQAQAAGDAGIDAFLTILTQVTDFQTFIDMVRDAHKRKYVMGMMKCYANMITQQQT